MRIRTVDISDEAADVLRRATWDGPVLKLPAGQLDRPLYAAVDKAIKALGGKWNRGMQGHLFPASMVDELAAALDAGAIVDQKKTMEQFFTPADLAARMAEAIGIEDGTHVLEPSAGNGRLVKAALDRGAIVTAVEMDRGWCGAGGNDSKGGLLDLAAMHHGQIFIFGADFLEWTPASPIPIDAVLMNPPFSGNQDIRHVAQALRWLRPGGKMAAIMSPHFTFAQDVPSREFRALIGYPEGEPRQDAVYTASDDVADCSIELLPAGTFKAEGTNVSAVLVIIEKAD